MDQKKNEINLYPSFDTKVEFLRVEYPGIVCNVNSVLATLGGQEHLQNVRYCYGIFSLKSVTCMKMFASGIGIKYVKCISLSTELPVYISVMKIVYILVIIHVSI